MPWSIPPGGYGSEPWMTGSAPGAAPSIATTAANCVRPASPASASPTAQRCLPTVRHYIGRGHLRLRHRRRRRCRSVAALRSDRGGGRQPGRADVRFRRPCLDQPLRRLGSSALFAGWRAWDARSLPGRQHHQDRLWGADLRTAFATTARQLLKPEELERQPEAGDLFAFTADVPGMPCPAVDD